MHLACLSQCSSLCSAKAHAAYAQPMSSLCSANVSQSPAYAQQMSSLCSANASAQPMLSLCSANVQPMLSQCPAYAQLPKMPSQCLANASASPANAQQANAQPMPKGASQLQCSSLISIEILWSNSSPVQ